MSDSHSSLPADTSQGECAGASADEDSRWEQVAEAIDAFSKAWESSLASGTADPELFEFMPAERHLALFELVKVDLEYRWQYGRAPQKIEAYAERFPDLGGAGSWPVELIHEELQVRMQAGDRVTEAEIRQRFSSQATALCDLVGGLAVTGTPTCTYYAETVKGGQSASDVQLATAVERNFKPGQRVDDFQLLTQLGRGAFAQVFLARQISLERLVALKISSQKGSEPQTLAQLDHPHIVRVFDLRQNDEHAASLLYMEVVPGGTLYEVAKRVCLSDPVGLSGQLLLDRVDDNLCASGVATPENSSNRHWLARAPWHMAVCHIGAQLAEGLAYAHSKGVMHRDIKPANVLLTPDGAPKLADFNVSYNGGRADESPADTFGGSLVYMSPEQLQACHPVLGGSPKLVRGSSDVYSLGVMLWELLSGRRPFEDEAKDNAGELARLQRMIDGRHYVDFSELCKQLPRNCPESLRRVLVCCLQPRKDERFQSAEEAARALRLCLQPRCWKLLQEPTNRLAKLLLQFPVLMVIVVGLMPNLLAGFFNYRYNVLAIIQDMPTSSVNRFDKVQLVVNSLAFPLGITIAVWAALRAMRLLSGDNKEEAVEGGRRVLLFGRFVSMFALVMWTVSGLIFPIAIDWGQSIGFYLHFFLSLALCGIAAVAYPYFLLTALAVRLYIPALMRNKIITGPRWQDLQLVRKLNHVHLLLCALMPLLGVLLLAFFSVSNDPKWPVLVVSGGGLIGFLAMFFLYRYTDKNLSALEKVAVEVPRQMT